MSACNSNYRPRTLSKCGSVRCEHPLLRRGVCRRQGSDGAERLRRNQRLATQLPQPLSHSRWRAAPLHRHSGQGPHRCLGRPRSDMDRRGTRWTQTAGNVCLFWYRPHATGLHSEHLRSYTEHSAPRGRNNEVRRPSFWRGNARGPRVKTDDTSPYMSLKAL